MKKLLLLSLIVSGLFLAPNLTNAGCAAGGPGEKSCSIEEETTILGLTIFKYKRAVSGCPDGTYACCRFLGTKCKKEESVSEDETA